MNGTKLGPYEIVAAIGAGGMGEVYRALDTRLGRDVAIKILPQHLTEKADARQRFEREARAVSSLNHPHICTLYDIGHQDGTDFIVMEYLEGETLAKRLEKGPLATAELLRVAIEIADALDKAHRQGILHRDLKPSNIMLMKTGAKLMDFGLAKAAVGAEAPMLSSLTQSLNPAAKTTPVTAEGTIVGTFQYMAPEQMEGKEADARSDIFSFGAVLFEMATGKRAFEGKTTASVIAAILEREPPPISTMQPMSPPALDRAVRICLAKDPDERFQSAHDLKLQLEWIRDAGSQAGIAAPVAARRKNRERIAWAVAALFAIGTILFGIGYFGRVPKAAPAIVSEISPPANANFLLNGNFSDPPALSPDGKQLAFGGPPTFGAASGDQPELWLRSLDSATTRPLAGTRGATFPFWSPDSRYIGYFANGKLNWIGASGGPPLALADAPDSYGGTWSRNGTILFVPREGPVYRVPASGGRAQEVTKLNASQQEVAHLWPQFLPDGQHFLFYALSRSAENSGTYATSLDGGDPKLILRGGSDAVYAPPGYLLFVRQGALMAQPFDASKLRLTGEATPLAEHVGANLDLRRGIFTASESGILSYAMGRSSAASSKLLWFDRNGKETAETGTPAQYVQPSLSPDGGELAVVILDPATGSPSVWVYNLARGTKTRLTFSAGVNAEPVWSPDGKVIAFNSRRSGKLNLYEKAADGTGSATPLVVDDSNKFFPTWSSDGRYVLYQRLAARNSRSEIWALPLFGDRKPFPVIQDRQFGVTTPTLSPDGKWLAYVSPESGRAEVYIVPFLHGSGKWEVSTGGGQQPRWRHDGKELFYLAPDNKIMSAEIAEQGSGLSIGKVLPLFQANPTSKAGWDYDVSADGKKFVVVSQGAQQASAPLTLVVNWPALLKKK
ncbi:MAG: protein kinase domain-containing protein [Candidatus Acidiferrales bacterium]